jgi:AAA domain, putative AbiEii toxin, Type IV TA system/AAA domain
MAESRPSRVVFVCDASNRRTWSLVRSLVDDAPLGVVCQAPGLESAPGDPLDDHLVAALIDADVAVLFGSFENPLLTGFQIGLVRATTGSRTVVSGVTKDDHYVIELCADKAMVRRDAVDDLWQTIVDLSEAEDEAPRLPVRGDLREVVLPRRLVTADPIEEALRSGPMTLVSEPEPLADRPLPVELTWIIRDLSLDFGRNSWQALEPNLRNAVYAGWSYACDRQLTGASGGMLRVLRQATAAPVSELSRFEQVFSDDRELLALLSLEPPAVSDALVIEQLTLLNFKGFERLTLDLVHESTLAGNWTCIAGINGAGKTSILQAACLALLGRRSASELGAERLAKMVRSAQSGEKSVSNARAEIRALVRDGATTHELVLPLSQRGVDEHALYGGPGAQTSELIWARLETELLIGYGATRNVSEYLDTRNLSLSPRVRRQMTLFDPLTQVAGVEALLTGGSAWHAALGTLCRILDTVLEANEMELTVHVVDDRLRFRSDSAELGVVELPDGFRSLVAWLGDLCVAWHESADEITPVDPTEIRGIVLLDEIDLHLHASLQRTIVQVLRRALPNVQWIVTTHSPLILSSFDRRELILLDREAEGGVRQLDRQILGFTTDEVYEWLMGTPSSSAALDEKLAAAPDDEAVAVILLQSGERDEAAARARLARTRELVARMTPDPPDTQST